MKTILIMFICLFAGNILFAQAVKYTTSGRIEFEKTVNLFANARQLMGKNASTINLQAFEQYQRNHQQFAKFLGTLVFNNNKTLFTPTTSFENVVGFLSSPIVKQFNVVYTDLQTGTRVIQKEVNEQLLVKDSIGNIKWKLTDETRDIAGYPCRRANGIIQDSVYVVAFYTDKIRVNGGPESFSGLPGMILGVALPHENVTWFATKITTEEIPVNTIAAPQKGRPVTRKQLYNMLKESTRGWGTRAMYEMKIYML